VLLAACLSEEQALSRCAVRNVLRAAYKGGAQLVHET
jgi:hypothetical protein